MGILILYSSACWSHLVRPVLFRAFILEPRVGWNVRLLYHFGYVRAAEG